jgi:hypothetical protein
MKRLVGDESYSDLVKSTGVAILVENSDDDYQGDTRMLVKQGRRYGILTFGWGSCSGCDALEAAGSNVEALAKLRQDIYDQIHWERGPRAMLNYIEGKDWSLDYGNWTRFIELASGRLKETLADDRRIRG